MRKFGIFAALYALFFSSMFCFVVDDEGTGGNEPTGNDIGDDDLDFGDEEPAGGNEPTGDDATISIPKEEWQKVNSFIEEQERKAAYESTITSLKEAIPGFDEKAVVEHLKAMHKENPQRAATYNNEAGFKAIWYELQQKAAKNDDVNGGKNKGGGGSADFESVLDGAMQGKPGSLKQAISMAL